MKRILLLMPAIMFTLIALAGTPVNEKVEKVFLQMFNGATEVSWYDAPIGCYTVYFIKDDIKYNVIYNKKGRMISSRRYYFEDKLPVYILFKLKRKYQGKSVYGVTEVMDDSGVTYHITMQDDKYWWIVKVSPDDIMEITQKLLKAK
jgi:hypothetical protein